MPKLLDAPISMIIAPNGNVTFPVPVSQDEIDQCPLDELIPTDHYIVVTADGMLLYQYGDLVGDWEEVYYSSQDLDCVSAQFQPRFARLLAQQDFTVVNCELNVSPGYADFRHDHTLYAGHIVRTEPVNLSQFE